MQSLAPSRTHAAQQPSRGLHIALWVVQVVLGGLFLLAGIIKSTQPMAELANVVGMPMMRFIGVSEIAGALGLILPALTRIRPGLTPLAGAALVLVMLLASGYNVAHERRTRRHGRLRRVGALSQGTHLRAQLSPSRLKANSDLTTPWSRSSGPISGMRPIRSARY
jgi:hypothetical protein